MSSPGSSPALGLFGHQGVFVRPGEKLSKGTLFEYLGVLRTQEEDEVLVSQGSSIERLYEWEITHRGHTFVLMGYRTGIGFALLCCCSPNGNTGNLTALINDPKSFPPTDSSTETRGPNRCPLARPCSPLGSQSQGDQHAR